MLERVVLNQSRFRTPGVAPDARGVLLGQKGVLLIGTLEGVVRFLRIWSRDASLDDLAQLAIRRVTTPLGGHEMVVEFAAQSSYVLDRASAIARLLGGFAFTGTARHFVKYRDVAAPLGYDVAELLADPGDLALYHDAFQQAYRHEREIPLRELLLRLSPARTEEPQAPETVLVLAKKGIGPSLQGYLYRSGVAAGVSVVDRPARSAFGEGAERLHLFRIEKIPERVLALLRATPGIRVFSPVLDHVAVEVGHRHPVELEGCAGVFDAQKLTLFPGGGAPVEILDEIPPWTPIETLSSIDLRDPGLVPMYSDAGPIDRTAGARITVAVPARLAPSSAPWTKVVATIVPPRQIDWLRKLVYALPPSALQDFQAFLAPDRVVLWNPKGIDAIPLGTFYTAIGSDLFVPAGWTLIPHVDSAVLRRALGDETGMFYFFEIGEADGRPFAVRQSSFVPLSHRSVLPLASQTLVAVDAPAAEPAPPEVLHGPVGTFPLWGVPGKTVPKEGG